jgi:hypothetical protein
MINPRDLVIEAARLRKLIMAALLGKVPTASEDFDRTRVDALIFDEVMRIRKLVVRELGSVERGRKRAGRAPALETKMLDVIGELQQFVLQHPVAAQKVFTALVAEGRRYAATDAGARRSRDLASLPAMARARQFWESSLAGMLEEGGERVLPSSYVEIILQGAGLKQPEALLSKIQASAGSATR